MNNEEAAKLRNILRAKQLYEKAASLGSEGAMYALGDFYRLGAIGISANKELALVWLEKAA